MNKKQYLAELTGLLAFLSASEREQVIACVEAKFDDLGEGREMEFAHEYGTPMKLTISINRNGVEAFLGQANEKAPEPEEAAEEIPPETVESEEAEEAVEEEIVEEAVEEAVEEVVEEPVEEEPEATEEEPPQEEVVEEAPEPKKTERMDFFPELDIARGITNEIENKDIVAETSVLGAIAFGLLAIVFGVPLALISLAFIIAVFIPPVIFVNFSIYGMSAGVASLAFIPDALLVFGVAFFAVGMTALLILLALTITKLIGKGWVASVSAVFYKLVRKGVR